MTTQGIAVREIPEGIESIRELEERFAIAVRQRELLEKYITERLTPGKHFYKVQGSKNSLTKEGAELICLPHGYRPAYTFEAGPSQPPEDDTPYQLTVKCRLMKGESFAGEGIGSASSHITTREDGRKPRQPDIGLRHNATLKMAQKSAYIAATLNATAASEFFTQDIEDGAEVVASKDTPKDNRYLCPEHHGQTWTKHTSKDGKTSWYSHKQGDGWCNMKDARLDAKDNRDQPQEPSPEAHDAPPEPAQSGYAENQLRQAAEATRAAKGELVNPGEVYEYAVKVLGYGNRQQVLAVPGVEAAMQAKKYHEVVGLLTVAKKE